MKQSNDNGGAQMVVVLTIIKMSYLVVGIFNNLVGLFFVYQFVI